MVYKASQGDDRSFVWRNWGWRLGQKNNLIETAALKFYVSAQGVAAGQESYNEIRSRTAHTPYLLKQDPGSRPYTSTSLENRMSFVVHASLPQQLDFFSTH